MLIGCKRVRWYGGMLLAAVGVLLVACGSGGQPSAAPQTTVAPAPATAAATTTKTYVGTVGGTDAFLSVVVDGARAMVYVCDGVPGTTPPPPPPTIQAWFNGPSDGTRVDVSAPAGRVQLQLTDTTMTGTLTLADGRTAPVSGSAVTGDAGLYRAASGGAVAGWILSANGEQRGGFGFEGGGGLGVPPLTLKQTTINFRNLSNTQIAKVGITPIPIP